MTISFTVKRGWRKLCFVFGVIMCAPVILCYRLYKKLNEKKVNEAC